MKGSENDKFVKLNLSEQDFRADFLLRISGNECYKDSKGVKNSEPSKIFLKPKKDFGKKLFQEPDSYEHR
jgi:hypothetical protein